MTLHCKQGHRLGPFSPSQYKSSIIMALRAVGTQNRCL
jgi:hypothetical protein